MQVQDKVVIVTGASSGIGEATAKLLAQHGAKLVLAARSQDKLTELARKLPGSFVIPTDMANEEQVKEMVQRTEEHFGRIDILINNAGRGYYTPIERIDMQEYHDLFELDVVGPLIAMQAAIPLMRKQGTGMIVNISSGTTLMYRPNLGAYSSLKRALNALTLTARAELSHDGIVVSLVYPYITNTNFASISARRAEPGERLPWQGNTGVQPPDTAEHVAELILATINSEEAETYAHEWMKNS
jgi:short-subunit dehydrogenase